MIRKQAMKLVKNIQKIAFALTTLSFALILPLITINIKTPIQNASLNDHQIIIQNGGRLPALSRLGSYQLLGRPGSTVYDEQIGATFTQDFTSLAYTVTAIAQTGTDNYGPAYLLNGLGNTGYWYQVGLSYNWDPTTAAGFQFESRMENSAVRIRNRNVTTLTTTNARRWRGTLRSMRG